MRASVQQSHNILIDKQNGAIDMIDLQNGARLHILFETVTKVHDLQFLGSKAPSYIWIESMMCAKL